MSGKRGQRLCRICRMRPPWRYSNCLPDICKRCYHKHIWPQLLASQRKSDDADELPKDLGDDPRGAFQTGVYWSEHARPLDDASRS